MDNDTLLTAQPFSAEQKEYLQGFFAGVSQRLPFAGHLPDGRITSAAVPGVANAAEAPAEQEESVFGTPVSDLCEQELWKLEKNGLAPNADAADPAAITPPPSPARSAYTAACKTRKPPPISAPPSTRGCEIR